MAHFLWSAKDLHGHSIESESQAPNRYMLALVLAQQGLTMTACYLLWPWQQRAKLPKPHVRLQLLQQWQRLVNARLPMLDVVRLSTPAKASAQLRWQLRRLHALLRQGNTFSSGLLQVKLLPEVDVALLAAAEEGGFLATMLTQLAAQAATSQQLKRKIKRSLLMPAITLLIGLLVAGMLLLWLVPIMASMMAGQVNELPALTRSLLALSHWLQNWGHVSVMFMVIALVLLRRGLLAPKLGPMLMTIGSYIPILGTLLLRQQEWRLYLLLGAGLQGGVALLRCLDLFLPSCRLVTFQRRIILIKEDILAGTNLADAFIKAGLPEQQTTMLMIGQQTGQLSQSCLLIAKGLEQQMDERLQYLQTIIEPTITVLLASLVGGLVMAIYLPLLQLGTMLR